MLRKWWKSSKDLIWGPQNPPKLVQRSAPTRRMNSEFAAPQMLGHSSPQDSASGQRPVSCKYQLPASEIMSAEVKLRGNNGNCLPTQILGYPRSNLPPSLLALSQNPHGFSPFGGKCIQEFHTGNLAASNVSWVQRYLEQSCITGRSRC